MDNFPETQLQAAVQDIEWLRSDIRRAFDSLQQQANAVLVTHGRADLALSKVEGIEGADLVKRIEMAEMNLDGLEQRMNTAFDQVSNRITQIDQAHTALLVEHAGRTQRLTKAKRHHA